MSAKMKKNTIEQAPYKLEPLFLNPNYAILNNIKSAIDKADDRWARAKDQIKGAVTAYKHAGKLKIERLTIEHLRFTLQELEAVPSKQIKNELRILIAQLEKEKREAEGK